MSMRDFDLSEYIEDLEKINTKVFVDGSKVFSEQDVLVIENLRYAISANVENITIEQINQISVVLKSFLSRDKYLFDAGEHKKLLESIILMLGSIRSGIESVLNEKNFGAGCP